MHSIPRRPWLLATGFLVLFMTLAGRSPAFAQQPVEWTGLVGVQVNGTALVKTGPTGWTSGGAISALELESGDGYVEFTASETTTYRMLGLSHGNDGTSYTDIDFGAYLYQGK